MESIKRRRAQGLQDRYLYDYTFDNDNGQNPLMAKAHAYVDNWKAAYQNNTGLLSFGDVGTGKSFFAGCIVSALHGLLPGSTHKTFPREALLRPAGT